MGNVTNINAAQEDPNSNNCLNSTVVSLTDLTTVER